MTRYLPNKRPPVLTRREPAELQQRNQLKPPGSDVASLPPIKIAAQLDYRWSVADPADAAQYITKTMLKGSRWKVWKEAVLTKIRARGGDPAEIIESLPNADTGTIQLAGLAVFDFASLFDLLILDNAPPASHIAAIRALTAKSITVLLGPIHIESVSQATLWPHAAPWGGVGVLNNVLRAHGKDHLVAGVGGCGGGGSNGYGCGWIDRYEATGRTGAQCSGTWPVGTVACAPADATVVTTLHRWECRMTSAYLDSIPFTLGQWVHQQSYDGVADLLLASVLDARDKGTAAQDYPGDYAPDSYVSGWTSLLAALPVAGIATCWGQASDLFGSYSLSVLRRRQHLDWFLEPGRARTMGELEASIHRMLDDGGSMIVGGRPGNGDADKWFTQGGPGGLLGTWGEVRKTLAKIPHGAFYALACSTEGWLMHQPEFG